MSEQQAYSVEEFGRVYRVGRTIVFAEIKEGRLKTYKVGRRRYISAHAAKAWQMFYEANTNPDIDADEGDAE